MTQATSAKVSLRGLVDSDFDNPLRQFDGILDSAPKSPAMGYEGTRIDLKFKDIDNIIAVSSYNFPTAVINVGESNKNKSRWGYLANSMLAFLEPGEDIDDAYGKRLTMTYCDGQDGRPAPKPIWSRNADTEKYPDKMVPTAVWVVTGMEGKSVGGKEEGKSIVTWATENLIGKTRAEFNKWAFSDPQVRKDTAFQRSITDKTFINALVKLGEVAEDSDGKFQKV